MNTEMARKGQEKRFSSLPLFLPISFVRIKGISLPSLSFFRLSFCSLSLSPLSLFLFFLYLTFYSIPLSLSVTHFPLLFSYHHFCMPFLPSSSISLSHCSPSPSAQILSLCWLSVIHSYTAFHLKHRGSIRDTLKI